MLVARNTTASTGLADFLRFHAVFVVTQRPRLLEKVQFLDGARPKAESLCKRNHANAQCPRTPAFARPAKGNDPWVEVPTARAELLPRRVTGRLVGRMVPCYAVARVSRR